MNNTIRNTTRPSIVSAQYGALDSMNGADRYALFGWHQIRAWIERKIGLRYKDVCSAGIAVHRLYHFTWHTFLLFYFFVVA